MKRILSTLISLLFTGMALAQGPIPPSATYGVGLYYSPNYNYGNVSSTSGMKISTGTQATGAGTVTLLYGYFTTPDGRTIQPFTNVPTLPAITLDTGANLETVTPSAVSCQTPTIINTCQITATFTNIHGAGVNINSGDEGITEAINDASVHGGGQVFWQVGGTVTLSTSAANTPLTTVNIPTRSLVLGAVGRVTTTITGCTGGWSLGYTSGVEFSAANTTLVAGTTTDTSTLVTAVAFNAAATPPVVHCTTANATAGAVHARVFGIKMAAPAF